MSFKRVAILCPGPSVSMFAEVDVFYHDTIGVGRSVSRFSCRWWCFSDVQVYRQVRPIGRPLLFVPQWTSERLQEACPAVRREVVVPQESVEFPLSRPTESRGLVGRLLAKRDAPPPLRWTRYSGLAALALAWHLDADVVDLYGADLEGQHDFLGNADPSRHDDRWQRERLLLQQMSSVFAAAGRKVTRLLPAPRRQSLPRGETP
jgi:hypothetical protein